MIFEIIIIFYSFFFFALLQKAHALAQQLSCNYDDEDGDDDSVDDNDL